MENNNCEIKFYKLFDMLNRRGITKTDLRKFLSAGTVAKLSKNESITTDTLAKLCKFLDCQPGDIMEYQANEEISEKNAL